MALTLAAKTQLCALAADSKKAEDIVVLDVQPFSSVADHFLICSGTSDVVGLGLDWMGYPAPA